MLSISEIKAIRQQFKKAAENAKRAGFDGIELHSANGYLCHQFLSDITNERNDEYGGSVEKRNKFVLEVIQDLAEVFGKNRVGIKLSPVTRFNDMMHTDPVEQYRHLVKELDKIGIAFIEFVETGDFPGIPNLYNVDPFDQIKEVTKTFRPYFKNALIANNNFDLIKANEIISANIADLVSFARLFIANPDLVDRFENSWILNEVDYNTVYTPGAKGYTDYSNFNINNI